MASLHNIIIMMSFVIKSAGIYKKDKRIVNIIELFDRTMKYRRIREFYNRVVDNNE